MSLVENLVKQFGGFRLEVPRWEILDNGVTALSGPSGSGKSTLLRILLGLESGGGYKWDFAGENLATVQAERRRLGVVFQTLDLFPHLSAKKNIEFAFQARKIPQEESKVLLEELSAGLAMDAFLEKKAAILSGGEKQRVAIARAIAGKPRMLLLDEPFSSLDEDLKQDARALLQKIIKRYQIPALLITHDPRDIEVLADKVTYIVEGRIAGEGL